MNRITYQESTFADTTSVYARPDRLRLRQILRSRKLKCEFADELSVSDAMSMVQALQAKAEGGGEGG